MSELAPLLEQMKGLLEQAVQKEVERQPDPEQDREPYIHGTTKLKPDRHYTIKGGFVGNITVDEPGVHFYGDMLKNPGSNVYSPNSLPVFSLKAPMSTISEFHFHHPNPTYSSSGKLEMGDCIRDESEGSSILNNAVGRVNNFIFGEKGSKSLLFARNGCTSEYTGYFFYTHGSEDWMGFRNNIWGSDVEQPIRCSPWIDRDGNLVSTPKKGAMLMNTIRNQPRPGKRNPKGCLDVRQSLGFVGAFNDIYSYPEGGAIAMGPRQDGSRVLNDGETASDVACVFNRVFGRGQIQHRMVRRCVTAFNELYDYLPNVDIAIGVHEREENKEGTRRVEGLKVAWNKAYLVGSATSSKPVVRHFQLVPPGQPVDIFELENVWAQQPVTAPARVSRLPAGRSAGGRGKRR